MERKRQTLYRPLMCLILLLTWSYVVSENRYRNPEYLGHVFSAPQNFPAKSTILCGHICLTSKCAYFKFEAGVCTVHYSNSLSSSGAAPSSYVYSMEITDTTGLTNVALGKPTFPSTFTPNFPSGRVVDSDMSTQYYSFDTNNPWWSVNLGSVYTIKAIDVLPLDMVKHWFSNAKIYVGSSLETSGDFSSYTLVGVYPGTWDGVDRIVFLPPVPIQAQYVAVQLFSNNYLNICDVQVLV